MRAVRTATVLALFCAITAGAITAQEKASGKAKGQLPQGFTKLNLTDEQKTKIYDIGAKYKAKVDELQKQIADLKEKQRKDEVAVLTEAQRTKLKEILLGEDSKSGSSKN